jgi:hypothetical protein
MKRSLQLTLARSHAEIRHEAATTQPARPLGAIAVRLFYERDPGRALGRALLVDSNRNHVRRSASSIQFSIRLAVATSPC